MAPGENRPMVSASSSPNASMVTTAPRSHGDVKQAEAAWARWWST